MFWETKGFKRLINFFFGFGASIVMIGAMSKLAHIDVPPFTATQWIVIGLGTEAFLFFIQGLIPPQSDYYWQKLYPGLDQPTGPVESSVAGAPGTPGANMGSGITAQLDEVLEDANVNTLAIERLGNNLAKLSENIEKMNDVADLGAANSKFVAEAQAATSSLEEVQKQMNALSSSMAALSSKYDSMLSAMKN